MTDKEKLDKLVAEIERRIAFFREQSAKNAISDDNSCMLALIGVLGFYDSMQEECNITGIKSKHATGKLKECLDTITDESLAKTRKQLEENPQECIYARDNYTDEDRKALCEDCKGKCAYAIAGVISTNAQIKKGPVSEEQVKESLIYRHEDKTCKEKGNSLTQEPVSIDFEQELYKAFGQVKDFTLSMRIAKWFYDMGKNSQEPVSEELEKEIDSYFAKWLQGSSDEGCFNPDSQLVSIYDCHRIARHFANWQKQKNKSKVLTEEQCRKIRDDAFELGKDAMKQQMMNNAITAEYWDNSLMLDAEMRGKYSDGNEVKLIIIKED